MYMLVLCIGITASGCGEKIVSTMKEDQCFASLEKLKANDTKYIAYCVPVEKVNMEDL